MIKNSESYWYEFNEWQEAFKQFYVLEYNKPGLYRMVVSTNEFTSGYWIEFKTAKEANGDVLYDNVNEVKKLEAKVRAEIKIAEKEKRSPQLML